MGIGNYNSNNYKSVAGCRGINNYTLVNVLPSCTETEHSQQEVLTLTQMSSPVTTGTSRRHTTPGHNTPWQCFKAGRQRPQTTRQEASTNTSSPQPLVRISTPNNAAVNTKGTPDTSSPGDTTTTTAGLPTRSSRQITWRPHSCLRHALWCSFPQPQNQSTTTFLPVLSERHEHHRDDNKRKDTFISYEFSYHCQICFGSYILQFG